MLSDFALQASCSAEDSRNSPATEMECGDMEVSTTTSQLQDITVTPGVPCNTITSTEEESQPGGDCIASNAAEMHQETVCKADDDSEDSDRLEHAHDNTVINHTFISLSVSLS